MIAAMGGPTTSIDLYCEREHPGVWAEPLNLGSNLAFAIAAIWAYRRLRTIAIARPTDRRWLVVLIALTGSIAIGSALFHSLAVAWAQVADVVPIALYLVLHLAFLLHLLGASGVAIAGGLLGFGALTGALALLVPAAVVNGSNVYFGAAATLIAVAIALRNRGRWYGAAAFAFAISLGLRSIDLAVCPSWPLGTHFGWHLCNGFVLAATLAGAMSLAESSSRP